MVLTARQMASGSAPLLGQQLATVADPDKDIFVHYWGILLQNQDEILQQNGSVYDFRVYREILNLPLFRGIWQQRVGAYLARDWDVLTGALGDPDSEREAARVRAWVKRIGFDELMRKLFLARWYGYGVAEPIWERATLSLSLPDPRVKGGTITEQEESWIPTRVMVRRPERFIFDLEGNPRLRTRSSPLEGIALDQPYKWMVVTSEAEWDGDPYGIGLAKSCYWHSVFLKALCKAWLLFTQTEAGPRGYIKYPRGATATERQIAKNAAQAFQQGSWLTIPEGFVAELLKSQTNGAEFDSLYTRLREEVQYVIVGQSVTSTGSSGFNGGDVQQSVMTHIVKGDADVLDPAISSSLFRWSAELNGGEGVAWPSLWHDFSDPIDLDKTADTHLKFKQLGWTMTDDSMQDLLGDGWVKEEQVPDANPPVNPVATDPGAEFAQKDDSAELVQAKITEQMQTAQIEADDQILKRIREELLAGVNAGESIAQIQARLDGLLTKAEIQARSKSLLQGMILAELAGAVIAQEESRYEIVP